MDDLLVPAATAPDASSSARINAVTGRTTYRGIVDRQRESGIILPYTGEEMPMKLPGTSTVTLYNVFFPFWMLMFVPISLPIWFLFLFGNLFVDGLVLFLGLRANNIPLERKPFIGLLWRIWLLGYAADLSGAMVLALISGAFNVWPMLTLPHPSAGSFASVAVATALAGFLVARFDHIVLTKQGIPDEQAWRIAKWMGLVTAPWVFFIPTPLS
ncbi:hypothetical protein GTO89_06435 [Heliobacterium gestii]|uniref:Uncharacterized protein n=1 Tax=Heliomicrobium gestii TaxID=2699 RepID=A0A845LDY8_HELGE|nr:hypothetical protein [Heliomicrobium gestii]MBM7865992.1 hypothetical protein [Heliomicrobium gestii]MZP42675.1 hypothetical protein [Heliomicrobium gestii]